jgi:uncharacterized membrane-anchored protein YjiN (DUF445 family)
MSSDRTGSSYTLSLGGFTAPVPPDHPDDEVRRRRLRRNRMVATGLLVLMGALAIATHLPAEESFVIQLLRAVAEAGLVGGLADWFAVTALFRHPLGLPIPHTAIIPSSKDRIGQTLGRFVERNFLTEEALLQKLRDVRAARRFAEWLATPETAALIAHSTSMALPHLIRSLRMRDLHEFVDHLWREQLQQADIAPIIGRIIKVLTASGEADALFDRIIQVVADWLEEHRADIDQAVRERSRWWIPRAIDRRVAAAIVAEVTNVLNRLGEPEGDLRMKLREMLSAFIDDLSHSSEYSEQINAAKNRLIDHPEVRAWLASIGTQVSTALLDDLATPSSKTRDALERAITVIGQTLLAGEAMQRHIDSTLERLAVYLVSWRGEIGLFIAEVVHRWDTRTLAARLELVVGSDLQYIRMNGTIVGALAGGAIFMVARLLA